MDTSDIAVAAGDVYLRRSGGSWTPADEAETAEAFRALVHPSALERPPLPSDRFVEAVDRYLAPMADSFNYGSMRESYLNGQRFQAWVRVVSRYKPLKGASVLASGCGVGGSILAWWAGGAECVRGLEIDPVIVEMGRLQIDGVPGTSMDLYDGRRIPADDGTFDIIESMDVLEHVPWPSDYLAELRRVVKPDGVVLLTTPNRLWPIEQHLNVLGPPWMSIGGANRFFPRISTAVGRVMPNVGYRMSRVPTVREYNVSFRGLRSLAKQHGFRLELLQPELHRDYWPFQRHPLGERLEQTRWGKFIAPTRHLSTLLWAE